MFARRKMRAVSTEPTSHPVPTAAEIAAAIEVLKSAPKVEIQWQGYDFQEFGYYSPVNELDFLSSNRDLWHDRALPVGIEWDFDAQLAELARIAPLAGELRDVPDPAPAGPPAYHWENDFWRGIDALVHYSLLRHRKPARVVEIGTGWSSLLMARALGANEAEGSPATQVTQIEPYPREELLASLPSHWTSQVLPLQRADLSAFEALEAGDVCFYDGSHVSKIASDVNWFFFEVLPRLKPGVLVHLHDIFWPEDYPDEWVMKRGQTWNEQYVLQAFLMYNPQFRVVLANHALVHLHPGAVNAAFGDITPLGTGGSVWLERVSD